jgi:F420-dependent oxidoreductase-like protein
MARTLVGASVRVPFVGVQVFGDQIRFGLHSGPQNVSFEDYLQLVRRAEELGYDWISDFDHFMPIFGDPDGGCFEGTSLMAAMAAHTSRIHVGILVTGVTYRHPAVAANIAATIDHISGGRAEYGVGAAWFEKEHDQYGIPFPRIGVRMDMLDEACRIMRGLWTEERFSFEGKHFQLKDAQCDPKPVQDHLPLVIGGSGEKRTLRIVAEHGDIWNTFLGEIDEFKHKLSVLEGHCNDVGRDPADIRKSLTFRMVLAEDEKAAEERRSRMGPSPAGRQMFVGTPEQAVEQIRPFAELGGGDFLLAAAAPYQWETIELVAREVAPAVREAVAA